MNTAIGRPAAGGGVPTESPDIVQGIDHLIVAVRDLDRSQRLWQALGFAPTRRGFHQTGGTANHLLMLDGTYIELLGVADRTAPSPYLTMAEQDPGLWGIALRGSAIATHRFWCAQGLDPATPTNLARAVDINGREELARFALTQLPRSPELPWLLFCCEHLTRQFVWRPDLAAHPNGASRLREVWIVDTDARARRHIERITGRAATGDTSTGTLELADSRVSFLSEAAFTRRFGEVAAFKRPTRPTIAGFGLVVNDIQNARRWAQSAGYPMHQTNDNSFITAIPDDGVLIEWTPAH
jgi:catechol 2,3-dioxygenase-like lactoylglutathione lyase family enzyme